MQNIDLSTSQFDIDLLYDEAKKLGLDFGDLEEYGFDVKSVRCGGKTCINREKVKDFDKMLSI